ASSPRRAKANSTPQKQNYRGARARGNFREIASNRPQKRSAFGNCTKIGGLWPDKYLSRLPNPPPNCPSPEIFRPPPARRPFPRARARHGHQTARDQGG